MTSHNVQSIYAAAAWKADPQCRPTGLTLVRDRGSRSPPSPWHTGTVITDGHALDLALAACVRRLHCEQAWGQIYDAQKRIRNGTHTIDEAYAAAVVALAKEKNDG